MLKNNLKRVEYDGCVYLKKIECEVILYLLLYVNDVLIACTRKEEIENVKVMLESEFKMKDMGASSNILGMQNFRDETKENYSSLKNLYNKILKKFSQRQYC